LNKKLELRAQLGRLIDMVTTKNNHTIERIVTRDAMLHELQNYTQMPIGEIDSKLKALRTICNAFSVGGLSQITLLITYDENCTTDEDWTCNIKLPEAVETKNQIMARVHEKFHTNQIGRLDAETNEAVFTMSNNMRHDTDKIMCLVNANIRAQNKTTDKNKARQKLTHKNFKSLLDAMRALTSPMANGRTWEDISRFYRRRYMPQKVTFVRSAANPLDVADNIDNYDYDFDENQRLTECVNGIITTITVRTQPFNIGISEEVSVSRSRRRRFILENTDE